jgi:uncharacterized protein YdaU (DUF1376 family)
LHYYKRNLGDYAKKAGRLSILQHGVYNLLIDACYDREAFPTLEEAIDWTWAASAAEIEAVEFVLKKFFELVDGRYVQGRIAEEIADYREKADRNKAIAGEREAAKREGKSTKRARSVEESAPNQEPITKNQEPKEKREPSASVEVGPDGPARADFSEIRRPAGDGGGGAAGAADAAAQAMRSAGLADVSASHPTLVALVRGGMTVDELGSAAQAAAKGGKGFAWALKRAEGQRRDAAAIADLPAAVALVDPDSAGAIKSDAKAFGLGEWDQMREQWPQFAARVRTERKNRAAGVVC